MSRRPALILFASLALNAALLTVWLRHDDGAAATSNPRAAKPTAPSASPSLPAASPRPVLATANPATLLAELRKTNLSPEVVDALVLSRIFARHDERRRALIGDIMKRPWWQTASLSTDVASMLPSAQRKELRDLEALARTETLRLLGPTALDPNGALAHRHRFTSPERAVLLDALLRDYADIAATQRDETGGLRVAADREREKFLQAEKERDLAALLPPAEREILELRQPFGVNTQRLEAFAPTEAEYRALHALHRDFRAQNPPTVTLEGTRPRLATDYPEFNDQLRATLGEARYAEWQLAGHQYTHQLLRFAPDAGLGPVEVREVSQLLHHTSTRSWEIAENKQLSVPEKTALLADLATQARIGVRARLGPQFADAFLRELTWLNAIATGTAVKLDGYRTTWQPVDPARRRPINRPVAAPRP